MQGKPEGRDYLECFFRAKNYGENYTPGKGVCVGKTSVVISAQPEAVLNIYILIINIIFRLILNRWHLTVGLGSRTPGL